MKIPREKEEYGIAGEITIELLLLECKGRTVLSGDVGKKSVAAKLQRVL